MFGKDFYPTPDNVIERMLANVDMYDKVILEPSAGKGNIVDFLQTRPGQFPRLRLYLLSSVSELQSAIISQGNTPGTD